MQRNETVYNNVVALRKANGGLNRIVLAVYIKF